MDLLAAEAGIQDESRQGEAYRPLEEPIAGQHWKKRFYIESYGCAMNFADSEVVASILAKEGYGATLLPEEADLVLINTCSIRDKAEQTVRKRLSEIRGFKKKNPGMLVGILGCMAERLKSKLLEEEKLVDLVVGPDAYRSLPALIEEADNGQKAVNVLLSREETYGDIAPIRLDKNGVTAFVSIMRGCNNMCSFCVVPFTRGRERSRDADSIIHEVAQLVADGYREVTLLGQNVDSYYWVDEARDRIVTFAGLLEMVAQVSSDLRVRFSTSHPKDITDEVLFTMAKYENICNYIHLPVQSGSNRILQLMNRTYTREWYLAKLHRIREILPDCGISTDIIAGFCSETEEDHQLSLSLMAECRYDLAYMYFYSERPGTLAERRYTDDVPEAVKKRRLQEIIDVQRKNSLLSMQQDVGKTFRVLIESNSKKSDQQWQGRTDHNKVVVFPKNNPAWNKGSYVDVTITDCTAGTLFGEGRH
ncbi:MAG TPA: tRNA (N6-isopentenyl adenosine(37)-C2)-methylthiotransferase MiaB [Sediminibacterium sp.]|nr:tRNA (N6-isopentenyl adenosine(37)-C2)-methylthiotransferase MiaB [Sediminibacterium sp.]